MHDTTELFCFVYDFCSVFELWWHKQLVCCGVIKRNRPCKIHLCEIVTLMIMYHESGMKCFKSFYFHVLKHHSRDFNLVCYDRFVALVKRALPVIVMLLYALMGEHTFIKFVDSTPYRVCKYSRRFQHRVFKGLAASSKNSLGWFYGLKLHFVFNAYGEIIRLAITPANVDDRVELKQMAKGLFGKLFGDRSYLGAALFRELFEDGLQLITRLRRNMKNILMSTHDKLCLGKRMVVESIFSSIKSCGTFEHSRHRNVANAFCHIFTALISYQLRELKPTLLAQHTLT